MLNIEDLIDRLAEKIQSRRSGRSDFQKLIFVTLAANENLPPKRPAKLI